MSSGGNTSTTTSSNTIDPFIKDLMMQGYNAAANVASIPYQAYTGPRIAQFRPEEQQAFNIARQTATNQVGQSQLNDAIAAAQRAAGYSPEQFQQNVQGFMSPYNESVVDATMRRLAQARAERDASTKAQMAASGAFGNERRGVYEAQLAGQQDINDANTLANLYQQGYTQAAGLASGLPAQQLAASGALATLGNQNLGLQQAYQNMLSNVGLQQRTMAQNNLDLAYQDFLAQRGYPLEQLKILQSGISGLPSSTTTTGTTTTPGQGFLGTAADVVGILGGINKIFPGVFG